MTVNRKPTGVASSVPAGLAWGAVASLALTLAGSLMASKLINDEVLSWDHSGYAVLLILLLSAWSGAMVAAGKIKRQRLIMCLASGALYFVLLLGAAALFFGGQYSGVGETGLLIFCGSMLGVLAGYPVKTRRNGRKRGLRNR